MSYIKFDKLQLINLEYSLNKELLRSNRAGSYSSTTIIGCNTRRYHGLLITRQPGLDSEHHVLLSTIDETVIQNEASFNLGIHKYKGGTYSPKGHKYVRNFVSDPIPMVTFRVGGVVLNKEMMFTHNDDRVIIKYTLVEANSATTLRFKPFLAFRNHHQLSKSNIWADTKYEPIANGIKMKLYHGYTPVCLQISKENEYIHVPDWYYNIEYTEEMERGYDYLEDLFVPGYFEVNIKKGESIYVSAGLDEINPNTLGRLYSDEVRRRIPRDSFENCLINSAHQMIVEQDQKTMVIAGYPWFGTRHRDTLLALPGITLYEGKFKTFKSVLASMIDGMKGSLFPESFQGDGAGNFSADTSLWFFWTLQQYILYKGEAAKIFKEYGKIMFNILEAYRNGTYPGIKMNVNGLIWVSETSYPQTWMNATVNGKPLMPRTGYIVEVNALWYNAIMFFLELAGSKKLPAEYQVYSELSKTIPDAFTQVFWNETRGQLADTVTDHHTDWSMRPNQLFATSLPYSCLEEPIRKIILDKIKSELVTSRGLRSLSPKDPEYQGIYVGDEKTRDTIAFHGAVWPWLLTHFAEAYLGIHGKGALSFIKSIYDGFEPALREHAIGTISELYDGDPPHRPGGAISMAWSVGGILQMKLILNRYDDVEKL